MTKELSFMAIVTLLLLIFVQGASMVFLYKDLLSANDYLAVWVPLLTLSVGYWFGKNRS